MIESGSATVVPRPHTGHAEHADFVKVSPEKRQPGRTQSAGIHREGLDDRLVEAEAISGDTWSLMPEVFE